ncbi:hypothetical protein COJ92_27635 [Priestia megaterium]|nr:hypothetical protein [Priestia megaterium]PFP10143.1 hypothetical protein COJ92_27635 [Priestia megaterium]
MNNEKVGIATVRSRYSIPTMTSNHIPLEKYIEDQRKERNLERNRRRNRTARFRAKLDSLTNK